jgi:hypothetical protein
MIWMTERHSIAFIETDHLLRRFWHDVDHPFKPAVLYKMSAVRWTELSSDDNKDTFS